MRALPKTFAKARRLRREMTLPEVQLWQALRGSGLGGVRFRRQHSFGFYVLDFYAPSCKLIVEVDGVAHSHPERAARDIARDAWLARQGIRTLRFNALDVLDRQRREDVLATIAVAIAELGSRIAEHPIEE